MRLYGSIQTKFWIHSDMQNASDQAKLLAVYLLSSMHTNMLGCFRIPVAYVSDDLKWSIDKVNHALDELSRIHFLSWDADSSYVFIHQFLKYNPVENPNQGKSLAKLFDEVPDKLNCNTLLINSLLEQSECLPKAFLNRLQTLSEPFLNQNQKQYQYQEQKQDVMSGKPDDSQPKDSFFEKSKTNTKQDQDEFKSQAMEVLNFLNEKTGRGYRPSAINLNFIMTCLKSGATVGQCFQVIAKKFREWHEDEEMKVYLRPETLFNEKKFESYLGEVTVTKINESMQ